VTSKRYPIPACEARTEIQVLNSRFIASAAPAPTVDKARVFIARVKREFADATHNVPAYLIGHGASVVAHCHDDGEPSGTAGRPALAVLSGSGLGDAVVVITRYFGGTNLGTGGLVRAYGDAVRGVLEILPRAERVLAHTVLVASPYSYFEQIRLAVAAHGGRIQSEAFGADVSLTAQFAEEDFSAFQAALQELSNGSIAAEVVETGFASIRLSGGICRKEHH